MEALLLSRDDFSRLFLEDLLRRSGFRAAVADNIQDAWQACQKTMPPLVLVDLLVHGNEGLGFCRRLGGLPRRAHSILLVVAGGSHVEDLESALEAGADDYIRRPLDGHILRIRLAVAQRHLTSLAARREAEEALRSSEARYRALFEASVDAIFVETPDGVVLECNSAACRIFGGTKKEEFLGRQLGEILSDDIARHLPLLVRETLASGNFALRGTSLRRNGEPFPCAVSSGHAKVGGQSLLVVYVRDLSRHRDTHLRLSAEGSAP
jgi:PAS domain S-box-containing protein